MLNAFILLAVLATGAILMYPRLANSSLWRATTTPLASIIGSGFLVLGPILNASYGLYAPLIMGALCFGAYLFGAAVRYNIAVIARENAQRGALEQRLETLASWTLAFAYIISVAYYLNLFGAFGVSLTELDDSFHARLLTSGEFILILTVGWTQGFKALELMEQVSVGIKLAIIVGLLFGLAWYFAGQAANGSLVTNPPTVTGWTGLTLAFGLIVTVQGFETTRYLGESYDAASRIRSMRLAQALSTVIYIIYIGLLAYVFEAETLKLDETAIIALLQIVAPILPVLLVAAALSAQFSAAVADTGGSGGLIAELTEGRITVRVAYFILVGVGLLLTWSANVFEIISYASRAFALYYALQSAIAAAAAWRHPVDRTRAALFLMLTALGLLIALLGTSVE